MAEMSAADLNPNTPPLDPNSVLAGNPHPMTAEQLNPNTPPQAIDLGGSSIQPQQPEQAPTPSWTKMFDPDGKLLDVSSADANRAQSQGYTPASSADIKDYILQQKYGGTGQQVKAGLEGVGRGVAGPAFTAAEIGLGVQREKILGREEANPFTSGAGEGIGIVGSALLAPELKGATMLGAAEKAGLAGAKLAGKIPGVANIAEKIPTLAKIGNAATKAAVENAMFQGSDELSKMILHDPNTSVDMAMLGRIGGAGAFGGVLGGALGSVSPLFKAAGDGKMGEIIRDLKSRGEYIASNGPPVEDVTGRAQRILDSTHEAIDHVYRGGMKQEELTRLLPQDASSINKAFDHVAGWYDKGTGLVNSLVESDAPKGIVNDVRLALGKYEDAVLTASEAKDSVKMFNALDELKNDMYKAGKVAKGSVANNAEGRSLGKILDFAGDVRAGLEDEGAWGKAGKFQKDLNAAISPALDKKNGFLSQATKMLTDNIGGDRVVSMGKVETLLKQAGEYKGATKQMKLGELAHGYDNIHDVIDNVYKNAGITNPLQRESTEVFKAATGKLTTGAKLYDFMAKHLAGEALGTGIGGVTGAAVGHPGIGAYFGEKILSGPINKIMPGIMGKLISSIPNGTGAKAAMDYVGAASKGENMLGKAVSNIFKAGRIETPKVFQDNNRQREALDKQLKSYQDNPEKLQNIAQDLGHYLPDHASALASSAVNAGKYLSSLRPNTSSSLPMDAKNVPNAVQKSQYNRALDIAQDPLHVMGRIKDGTITPFDVTTLKAIFPGAYNKMAMEIVDKVNNQMAKGEAIPYRVRQSLSIFMAQPMDSTMTPVAISSAQPIDQGPHPQQGNKPPPASSTKDMNKLANSYQTPSQKSESRNQQQRS